MSDRLSQVEAIARDLARALRYHIEAEAKRAGVAPAVFCPCHSDELARAAEFLDDDEDPEPVMDERDPVEVLAGPEPEGEPWDV